MSLPAMLAAAVLTSMSWGLGVTVRPHPDAAGDHSAGVKAGQMRDNQLDVSMAEQDLDPSIQGPYGGPGGPDSAAIDNHLDITTAARTSCVEDVYWESDSTQKRTGIPNACSAAASDAVACGKLYEAKNRGDHRKGYGEPGLEGEVGPGSSRPGRNLDTATNPLHGDSYTLRGEVHVCEWRPELERCEAGQAVYVCPGGQHVVQTGVQAAEMVLSNPHDDTDPCDGVTCDAPSGPCKEVGACAAGACPAETDKPDGTPCVDGFECQGGACVLVDRCLDVTCPPASGPCKEAGACAAGACPAETDKADGADCDDGDGNTINDACQGGTCVGTTADPCVGFVCSGQECGSAAALDQCFINAGCACFTTISHPPPRMIAGRAYTAGDANIAAMTTTNDTGWGAAGCPPAVDLAYREKWTNTALAEHTSVASFARATLHLMALGAPADLVDDTLQAGRDEVAHAKAAFALAGTQPLALPLHLDHTPNALPLQEVTQMVFDEGCLHETPAVLRAARALRTSPEGPETEFQEMVVRDEKRHAELAWRTVHWALGQGAELPEVSAADAQEPLVAALLAILGGEDFPERVAEHFDAALAEIAAAPVSEEL